MTEQASERNVLSGAGLDLLFREARTHKAWLDKPVGEAMLRSIWDLAKLPPTSANCSPMRVVFVVSEDAKERLKPALMEGNVEKTMTAPATAIVAYDTEFYERLPELFSQADARAWFVDKPKFIEETAFRNGTLQGAYLIMAARALGLDCGPMSGFSKKKVDDTFFPEGRLKSNFLCNIGYGDPSTLPPREKRLSFEEACRIE